MDHDQLRSDLRFVRAIVDGHDCDNSPALIFFLWAVVVLVGFALVDFYETWGPVNWSIAGPAGFVASAGPGWGPVTREVEVRSPLR